MTRRLLAAAWLVFLALACAAFVRANSTPHTFDFLFAPVTASTGTVLVLAFVIGWAAGTAGAVLWALRLVRERRRLERDLRLAAAEARTLRATAPAHAR